MALVARLAHGEDQPDRLHTETAPNERQREYRGQVEPLRVVDDAHDRPVLRDMAEQTQDRQANEEPIRRITIAQTKRGPKGIALRTGKPLQPIQKGRA